MSKHLLLNSNRQLISHEPPSKAKRKEQTLQFLVPDPREDLLNKKRGGGGEVILDEIKK